MASSAEILFGKRGLISTLVLLTALTLYADSVPPLPKLSLEAFPGLVRQQIGEVYDNVLKNPEDAENNGRLGMLLYAYEQYEFAEPCFERAAAFAPADKRWAYYLGRTQSVLRKHAKAAASFREALRDIPDYLPAELKLAESLFEAGNAEESRNVFDRILRKHPDAAAAHYGLGRWYVEGHQFEDAIEHLKKACDLFPAFGAAHFALARVYRQLGEKGKAQEHLVLYQKDKLAWPPTEDPFLAAVHDLKTGANARLRKGVMLAEAGQLEAAVAEHEAALAVDRDLVQAHIHLIALYGKLGQPAKAAQHYDAAVSLNPNLVDSHQNYAALLMQQNRYQEAEEPLRTALKLNPKHADSHNNYGYVLMVSGRLQEAAQHFRAALESQPNNRAAHFNLGRILIEEGKIQQAIDHLTRTLAPEDSETPRCTYALAAAYARKGDSELALKYMKEAREKAARLDQGELLQLIDRDLELLQKMVKRP